MAVYIQAAHKYHVQNPLCDDWLDNPVSYDFLSSVPLKQITNVFGSRCLQAIGENFEKAIATSMTVVEATGIKDPDAIIVGTAWDAWRPRRNL
jgi:hypothetical protein